MRSETSHDSMVECPLARYLTEAMRAHWHLPDEEQFTYSGLDWFLLLVLWRAWTSHNNILHQSGSFMIESSVHHLLNIRVITMNTKPQPSILPMSRKGKN